MTRSRVVKVRVTEAEYSTWTEMALSRSVSLSETIRRAMQGNTPPRDPKPLESLPVARSLTSFTDWDYPPERFTGLAGAETTPRQEIRYPANEGNRKWAEERLPGRRTLICPHGKPGFAFCPKCDQ